MYFIGVDSGGTNTSFILCDEHGRIYARHVSGTGGYISIGRDRVFQNLLEGIDILCKKAGIQKESISYAVFGFPGYGETADSEAVLEAVCTEVMGSERVFCECDCYLGWAGSLAMNPGVNIVSGTGSICYGVNIEGISARSSGWGVYCDEGSCRWIGTRLIQEFTRQADGRSERTILYEMFRDALGISNDLHFVLTLNHEYGPSASKTAILQMVLKDIYDAGDSVAAQIYHEAAKELYLAASTVTRKLKLTQKDFQISYSGGLFYSGDCILVPLADFITKGGGILLPPRFKPDEGAVLTAIRQVLPGYDFSDFNFYE